MGTLQLSEFRSELRFNLGNRTAADGTTDTRCNRWINGAYRHMTFPMIHDFRETHATYDLTLVADQSTYNIDATTVGFKFLGVRSVVNYLETVSDLARKRTLYPRNIRWFDRRTLHSGTPSLYAVENEVLHIASVPTSAEAGQTVRVRGWRELARLSADSDVTAVADYFDEVLLLGAQWFAERSLRYMDRAERTKQEYVALLNDAQPSEELEGENWDFQVDVNPHGQNRGMM